MSAADAATIHVSTNSPADGPGTAWSNAFHTIQAAVSAAMNGDTVLVTNGIYSAGGAATPGYALMNRVCLTNGVTVRSVNGPDGTCIVGVGPNGAGAVRCVYLQTNTYLIGFTLTNGHTLTSGHNFYDKSGGGAFLNEGGFLSNCIVAGNGAVSGGGGIFCWREWGVVKNSRITGNYSDGYGGGFYCREGGRADHCAIVDNACFYNGGGVCCTYTGILNNCLIGNNRAGYWGGGSYGAAHLRNCTIIDNTAGNGGGGLLNENAIVRNSIIFRNAAGTYPNWMNGGGGDYAYCCTTPLPSGSGNLTNDPLLAGFCNPHLMAGSPCINAGNTAYAVGAADLDGEPRLNGTVDIGCDEYWSGGLGGPLSVAILAEFTNAVPGYCLTFTADIQGNPSMTKWSSGDSAVFTNQTVLAHAWATAGVFDVVLTAYNDDNRDGVSATTVVQIVAFTNYVSPSGGHVEPFTSWGTAATTLQAAVDACLYHGGTVLVTDGVYRAGGRVARGNWNRVAVDHPITVRSVNGPSNTVIQGASARWAEAVRCAYLSGGGTLQGFTLVGGCTTYSSGDNSSYVGGGAFIDGDGLVSECAIVSNASYWYGGGAACYQGGILSNCIVADNFAYGYGGGGVYCYDGGRVAQCAILNNLSSNYANGGGVRCDSNTQGNRIADCRIQGNTGDEGGGVSCGSGDVVERCLVVGNTSRSYAGGAMCWAGSTLNRCVITGNTAVYWGGGVMCRQNSTLNNCLIAGNASGSGGGIYYYRGGSANHCTITGNSASNHAGGIYSDSISDGGLTRNCIVWRNALSNSWEEWYVYGTPTPFQYCCVTRTNGIPGGLGCITNNPEFLNAGNGDFRLHLRSPCIDSGTSFAGVLDEDLPGHVRPLGAGFDLGAYEYDSATTDSDGDTATDYEERIAATDGADSNDYFHITGVCRTNAFAITFACTNTRTYRLESSSSLVTGHWSPVTGPSNGAAGGTMTLTDTNDAALRAYRVGVSIP